MFILCGELGNISSHSELLSSVVIHEQQLDVLDSFRGFQKHFDQIVDSQGVPLLRIADDGAVKFVPIHCVEFVTGHVLTDKKNCPLGFLVQV